MQITIMVKGEPDKECQYCLGTGIIADDIPWNENRPCGCDEKSHTLEFDAFVNNIREAVSKWLRGSSEGVRLDKVLEKAILPPEGR